MTPKGRLFGNLSISTKLVGAIGIVFVISAALVGWVAFRGAEQALKAEEIKQLDAVRSSRARLIATYFKRIHDDLDVASRLLSTRQVLRGMPAALQKLPRQL